MNGRFTEKAQKVLVLAREEAKRMGHQVVGTEHILLGLIQEGEGLAAKSVLAWKWRKSGFKSKRSWE